MMAPMKKIGIRFLMALCAVALAGAAWACGEESGSRISPPAVGSISTPTTLPKTTATMTYTTPVETSSVPQNLSQTTPAASEGLDGLLAGFSVEREYAHIEELASDAYQGRKTGSAGASAAAGYISDHFSALGLEPWSELGLPGYGHAFTGAGLSDQNVIGVIRGTAPAAEAQFIILAAHHDHLGVSAAGAVFNGADDNAAGVAALIEAATIIRGSGLQPRQNIVLCSFSGEEQGQYGSQALGALITDSGLADRVMMINIDGIGATGGSYFGVWDEGAVNAAPVVAALQTAGALLGEQVVEEGTDIGSDAQSFDWQFGIPAVTVDWNWGQDETAFHPYYHTVDDDAVYINKTALSSATRVAIAGLWLLSN
jgi:hypothetical protein